MRTGSVVSSPVENIDQVCVFMEQLNDNYLPCIKIVWNFIFSAWDLRSAIYRMWESVTYFLLNLLKPLIYKPGLPDHCIFEAKSSLLHVIK